ncbi:MAG: hypothetical protein QXX41_08440 [Nitrososphaerota archaeon]
MKKVKRMQLDVETYRPGGEGFTGEEIILIGVLEDEPEEYIFFENFKKTKGERIAGERDMLVNFYSYLKDLRRQSMVEIVGFNILRYDVPLLIAKALKYGVVKEVFGEEMGGAHEAEFISRYWHDICIVDIMQTLLPFNNMIFKGLKLGNVVTALREWGCETALKDSVEGRLIAELFENGEYDKVREKNKKDLEAIRDVYRCLRALINKIPKELKLKVATSTLVEEKGHKP